MGQYINDTDLRFNLADQQLEYQSGNQVWLPAAPAATNIPTEKTSTVTSNVGPVLVYTVPTTGMYLIASYIVNTVSGTGGDAVGQTVINYIDPSGPNAMYAAMPSGTNATLLGSSNAPALLVAGATVTYTQGSGVYAGGYATSTSISVAKI